MRIPDAMPRGTSGALLFSMLLVGLLLVVGTLVGVAATGGTSTAAQAPAPTPKAPTDIPVAGPKPLDPRAAVPPVTPTATKPGRARGTKERGAVDRPGRDYYARTVAKRVAPTTAASFVPLYREAGRAFGVAWQLIAAVHRQETAFSTVAGTYEGLNAFGCCAGPMQFNVTNGPVTTWDAYKASFEQGDRPASYPNRTPTHPSPYDDFDAIMAAGALLRDGGATTELGGGSWLAAFGYYGRDDFGTRYASQVLGRAQGWAAKGFCPECPDDAARVAALDDAYGVNARLELQSAQERARAAKARRAAARKARRAARAKAKAAAAKRAQAARKDPAPADRPTAPAGRPPASKEPAETPPPPPAPAPTTATEPAEPAPPPAETAPANPPVSISPGLAG